MFFCRHEEDPCDEIKCCVPECCTPGCGTDTPECERLFCVQYNAYALSQPGNNLFLGEIFQEGEGFRLESDTTVVLREGFIYHVDYILSATPERSGFFQVIPYINNTPGLLYSFYAPADAQNRNASASGSFLLNQALEREARLRFHISYSEETTGSLNILGAVSIHPLSRCI